MALEKIDQLKKLLEDKKHVLIAFGKHAGGDAIGSALALQLYLANSGKRSDIASDGFVLPRQYAFLKQSDKIADSLSHIKTFIITLDVRETGVQELSYDLVAEKLRIFITPKQGTLSQGHVKTAESEYKYDLIIILGTQELSSLGGIYSLHPELFEKIPVVNIDTDASNEHFGHMNIVDVTATATGEVLFGLFDQMGSEYVDTEVATALLTAMIAKTHSFRGENVRPHTLSVAGSLISMGANRDYIVQNLYRTRTISALRLWGEALSHLRIDRDLGLATATITREDFARSGAKKHDLDDIVDELISNSPEAKVIALFYEDPDDVTKTHVTLSAEKGYDALELLKGTTATGNRLRATLTLANTPLTQATENISIIIRKNVASLYQ